MRKILVALFILTCSPVFAAGTQNKVITAQIPNLGVVQFLQGTDSAGTYKTLYTGGANGSIIKGLIATTNDASAAHLVTCQVVRSAVKYAVTSVNIPINSGFASGAPPVNLLSSTNTPGLPIDSDQNPFIYLFNASDTLQCTFATALTASDVINIIAVATDF
jgi:hypothetical protein